LADSDADLRYGSGDGCITHCWDNTLLRRWENLCHASGHTCGPWRFIVQVWNCTFAPFTSCSRNPLRKDRTQVPAFSGALSRFHAPRVILLKSCSFNLVLQLILVKGGALMVCYLSIFSTHS